MSIDYSLKCRTCLKETNTYYKSIEDVEERYNILDMLESVVPHINIRLTSSSTLYSTLVCEMCVEKLLSSYKFQQMCIQSNIILQGSILPITTVKDEDADDFIDDPLTIESDENNSTEEFEEYTKNLDEEINSHINRYSGNDDSNSSISQAQLSSNGLDIKNFTKDVDVEQKTLSNVKTFQCKYCPKTFTKKNALNAHGRAHKKNQLPKNIKETVESDFVEYLEMSETLQENDVDSIIDLNIIIKEDTDNAPHVHNEASNDDFNNYLAIEPRKSKLNESTDTEIEEIERNTKKRIFSCKICGKTFHRRYGLKRHKSVHSAPGPHECKTCNKIFKNAHNLGQHMLVHTSTLCPHCGKTFGKTSIRSHVERCEGMKKYQCPDCPKRFNCRSDLICHSQAHTTEKPHACDICNTRFTRKYTMKKHKKLVHGGERAFKCDQCNMTFKQLHILKRHMFTHTGEKPYTCKYCDCAYAQSGDLIKHLRNHLGINTYRCDQCPESFKYQVELRHHQSQHYKLEQQREQTMSENAQDHEQNMQKQEEEN